MKKIFLLLLVSCRFLVPNFDTFADLKHYVESFPESPQSDSQNWIYPDFSSFFEAMRPNIFQRISSWVGFSGGLKWNQYEFRDLLEKVVDQRESNNKKSPYEEELILSAEARCVVWGDLHAALHSFYRGLEEIKRQGIIDENFKVVKNDVYIIFLGDLVNRSPYSLEILNIVLILMDRNPDKVFYIRGNHERNGYWENFSMRSALRVYAQGIAVDEDDVIPGKTLINRFFSTLPDAVVIKYKNKKTEVIYCAHSGISIEELAGSDAEALILGDQRTWGVELSRGINFLGFSHGTAKWSLLSSPVRVYQDYFSFYSDTFIILNLGSSITEAFLEVYQQDIRKLDGFSTTYYDLIFSRLLEKPENIKIMHSHLYWKFGSTLAETGSLSSLGQGVKNGIDTAVTVFNQSEGLGSHFIRPYIFNDSNVPRLARLNIEKLVKDYDIHTIVCPVGTSTLSAYADRTKAGGDVAVFFPYTGSSKFRNPEYKNMVHLRSSYDDEVRGLIEHMVSDFGVQKFAFFYQNDSYGKDALDAAREELKKRGLPPSLDIPYSREQIDFSYGAKKIKAENPDAIGFFSIASPTKELLSAVGVAELMGRNLFGISFLESDELNRYLKNRGIKFAFAFTVPNPAESQISIVRQYRKAMDEKGLSYESNSLEGYMATRLLVDAFERVTPPITKEKLIQWFESLKNYKFEGLDLTFHPETRGFKLPVWIRTGEGNWIKAEN